MMKSLSKVLCVGLLLGLVAGSTGCTRVGPGYEGVKVNLVGSDRGVDDTAVVTGRVWFNPWTEEVYSYPVHTQTVVWTKDRTEGSSRDESISFNSKEGADMNADFALAYSHREGSAPHVFKKLRQDSEYIRTNYLRTKLRDAVTTLATKREGMKIVGEEREDLLGDIKAQLNGELGDWFNIETVAIVGKIRVDQRVQDSINKTIEAKQKAIEQENKVKGEIAIRLQKKEQTDALAYDILTKAQAQAEANRVVNASLTPELVQYERVRRWDGVLPRMMTGGEADVLFSVSTE